MTDTATPETRFEFGANWRRFLDHLTPLRIAEAEASLREKTRLDSFAGKSFLDIGSGSGLFSLAARNLGAAVRSFDYDRNSVACTAELRRRFHPDDKDWTVEQGSVLDESYMASLGKYDIVYSWGVLHHTGQMYRALELAAAAVNPGGLLFVAIYNDQGAGTRRWTAVKKLYLAAPKPVKPLIAALVAVRLNTITFIKRLAGLKNPLTPQERGMHLWYDAVDWAGGYPFEVAKPEEIFEFYRKLGFTLLTLRTVGGGHGCNEFVFVKTA